METVVSIITLAIIITVLTYTTITKQEVIISKPADFIDIVGVVTGLARISLDSKHIILIIKVAITYIKWAVKPLTSIQLAFTKLLVNIQLALVIIKL